MGIGETSSKALLIGKITAAGDTYQIWARNGNDLKTTGSSITTSNDWQSNTITFDGTTVIFNNDISVTNFNNVSLDKLVVFSTWKSQGATSGDARNIKVKPL